MAVKLQAIPAYSSRVRYLEMGSAMFLPVKNTFGEYVKTTSIKWKVDDSLLCLQLLLCLLLMMFTAVTVITVTAMLRQALRYKPEVRRFNSRWCHWIFSST
jgi:hypothetical protein